MKKQLFCALTIVAALAIAASSASAALIVGDVINIDLQENGNGINATSNTDGPYQTQPATPTWNVFDRDDGQSNLVLLDHTGQDDGLTLTSSFDNNWRSSNYSSYNTSPNLVVYDYWNDGAGTFSINNVPTGTYELYVVAGISQYSDDLFSTVTVGGVSKVSSVRNDILGDDGVSHLPSESGWVEGENYAKFTVVLSTPGSISGSVTGKIFLNGMQLVVVPEPATMSLLALGGIAMLRRRK